MVGGWGRAVDGAACDGVDGEVEHDELAAFEPVVTELALGGPLVEGPVPPNAFRPHALSAWSGTCR
ncbi:hypothetical protein DFR70_112221 [Nocardia tenerifensis]|uniref:Uncharacterized protein n=1 Tax=Nocardia tenerifensis TaxID=228006 RepID=A0A318JSV9_9NOCA|nr:hypothetical protein DFR70_112221 [Nocardia tenerifensis]